MTYYIFLKIQIPFDEAIARTEAALNTEGFGVISRINIQRVLKSKIDADFRPYTILGACIRHWLMRHCNWKTRSA